MERGQLENQYGPWLSVGGGKSSPQKEQAQNKYTSGRVHWGFRDGELVLERPAEREKSQ